jgi:hypothetical protein
MSTQHPSSEPIITSGSSAVAFMASVALHVAAKHRQALAVIERGRLR